MDAKTALLVALGLALGLPYVTVALLQGGSLGLFVFTGLFFGAILLVVLSDLRGEAAPTSESAPESDNAE